MTDEDGNKTVYTVDGSATSYTVSGLENGKAYAVSVTATNAVGTSDAVATNPSSVTPAAPYAPPSGNTDPPKDNTTVTVNEAENGTVSVDKPEAEEGDAVVISAKPADGYKIKSLTAVDENGKSVDITNIGNGNYRFEMVDGVVTVTAEFEEGEGSKSGFIDVVKDSYYDDAVNWAVENGITTGTSTLTFEPYIGCTREQFVTFLWREAGAYHHRNALHRCGGGYRLLQGDPLGHGDRRNHRNQQDHLLPQGHCAAEPGGDLPGPVF